MKQHDNSEAMRLADYARGDEYQRAADDAVDLLRQQSARIAELETERDQHQHTATSLLSLLADIRKDCGDNGKRMQPELVEFIGELTTERDRLRAEVIANRERDALKLAALHIHSEMRSIVQAGGSNEAIGREFRKRVILDVEDEVVKLRAEVERLTKPFGESHLVSLIEAAIQGHASTREAMRWFAGQITPKAAHTRKETK